MTHVEKAKQLYSVNFHCSQAVLAAFAQDFGLSEEHALRLGSCLGSGMRKGEVCGACTGALMVLGLRFGQYIKGDTESRNASNRVTDEFLARFKSENGSYICRELLKCDISTEQGRKVAVDNCLFTEFCPKMVESAVRIIENMMCCDWQ